MGDFTDDILDSFIIEVKSVKEQILQYNSEASSTDDKTVGFKILFVDFVLS